MTQLTNPATHNHPNFVRTQAALDAIRQGDYWPFFEGAAREVIVENGPGAGPWHITRGKDDLARMFREFGAAFDNNFHQDGGDRSRLADHLRCHQASAVGLSPGQCHRAEGLPAQ